MLITKKNLVNNFKKNYRLRCDHCEARKYGFSSEGCKECECDNVGSKDLQCDPSGQCPCFDNVEGRRCDRCKENKYDRHRGCLGIIFTRNLYNCLMIYFRLS